ncbi:MAG: hypothetical protein IT486_12790 [Gammaproteobacteria bacterium]|nr:hypothetical protein [Gammaproteobacteria bacterium]
MHSQSSGISVVEMPPRGEVIPACRESVAAFVGPAPRGPVDIPVAIRSLEEFLLRFGVPGYLSRMEFLLYQFFENGGTLAIVVRVCRSDRCNFIALPGAAGELRLQAVNPGPLEHLRASIDYDGIEATDRERFNLTVHRCRSPAQPLVEEQESYAGVTVNPQGPEFVGDALARSALVRLTGRAPAERPTRTIGSDAAQPVRYVYSRSDFAGDNTPTDYDLIGSRERSSGMFALEQVPWVDFLCLVPGVSGAALGPVALFAADRYCRERHALLILDPPSSWTTVGDVARAQRERGFTSANALTYFPALDNPPHVAVGGHLSAAGAIAGSLCGAGFGLASRPGLILGRTRPAVALDDADVHQLARLGVNALVRPVPGRIELGGLVTLARSGGVATSWNRLRQRRVALFVASSVARYTRWAAFQPPGEPVWQEVRDQVGAFLAALRERGLLAGESDREAGYVKCDLDTNRGTAGSGALSLIVGLALARPGDFVAFQVTHTLQGCSAGELGWQPGLALAG